MKLINRKDGAKLAGVSYRVFWDYVERGIIPKHCHVGGPRGTEFFWRVSDVEVCAGRIKEYQEGYLKKKHKPGPKNMTVQCESWTMRLKLDVFNKYLHSHVRAIRG